MGGPGLASSTHKHPGLLQRPARHLPKPTEAPRADPRPAMESCRGLLDGLVALVPTEQQGIARGLAKQVHTLFTTLQQNNHPVEGPEVITVTHLQKMVTEAVRAVVGPSQGPNQGAI